MYVKTDTKEKFHAITVSDTHLSASMTEELGDYLLAYLKNDASEAENKIKNVILIAKNIQSIDLPVAEKLVQIQQNFYENNASFVICEIQQPVEEFLDENELLEIMNITPTESEAWDIVQLEEIEREMFGEEE